MNKFFHSVYLEKDLCMGCLNCIKRCPTQAIRVRNQKASIIEKFCIDCGECVRRCPHHAKQTKQDSLAILEQFEYTVALPAPSLYGQFNNLTDVNIVLTALLLLGFDDVFEVSSAAELVSEEARKFIKYNEDMWPILSTACPTVKRLIRVRFPSLIEHLLPIKPPMEVAAELAKKRAMEKTGLPADKIGIIFLSPCPSKVTFTKSPMGIEESMVDGVIAIKDIYTLLLPHMKEAEKNTKNLATSGKIGIGWGISGGEAVGIITDSYLAADGIENVIQVLESLEDNKFMTLQFIELNACNGGCVGGVLNVENPYVAKAKIKQLNKYMPISMSQASHFSSGTQTNMYWTVPVEYEPVFRLGDTMKEGIASLQAVERYCDLFPGLDCGSCGAPTCKALAEDIVRGDDVTEKDCIHLLKDYFNDLVKKQEV